MNSAASDAALLGIDWGTSSLRAFLIGADGSVLDSMSTSEGIMNVAGKDFDAVFDRVVRSFPARSGLPVLMSGMITSRNGWVETPYAHLPLGADELAQSLCHYQTTNGSDVHFVTGAATEHDGRPDVMRGEETQIVGALASDMTGGMFVMPGTHSKWVTVSASKIVDFSTYMTGEVFAALKDNTILGTLMEPGPFDTSGFEDGVAAGLDGNANLLHNLFHVRTLPLMEKIPQSAVADYMSGLLIGTEIAAATKDVSAGDPVTIVGRSDLSYLYEIALRAGGFTTRPAPNDIVATGHFLIARAAGLLT